MTFDVRAARLSEGGSAFGWRGHEVTLRVPGEHNARNAAAALEACRLAGADEAAAVAALASFEGAGRRFQTLGETSAGARVIDDYAHHPTEVAATIDAARTLEPERVVAVFQPHLFSRTELLARDFGAALARADLPCVLDVYPARERPEDFPGVTGRLIAEAVADARKGAPVMWLPDFDAAERVLAPRLRAGDVVLVMGAGDVDALGRRLVAPPRGQTRPPPAAHACPTNTGSGTRSTPNARRTPPAISRASETSSSVVPLPRLVSASVCFEEIAMPSGLP